jgi:DNA polymerase III subunit alpha
MPTLTIPTGSDTPNRSTLRVRQEMEEIFADLPRVLENTIEIASKVEIYSIESKPIMPNFPIPETFADSDDYLRELTYQGALSRYGELSDEHRERIDFELATIKFMGYPDYFLIVQDLLQQPEIWGCR